MLFMVSLLCVKFEGIYGDEYQEAVCAGINCHDRYEQMANYLNEGRCLLEAEEIISIMGEHSAIREDTRQNLIERFEPSDCEFAEVIKEFYVIDVPLESFRALEVEDTYKGIGLAAKVFDAKGDFFISENETILITDTEGRMCAGEFCDLEHLPADSGGEDELIMCVGVLQDVIEIECKNIAQIRKFQ